MSEWRYANGREVTSEVLQPDYEAGLAFARVITNCTLCDGRGNRAVGMRRQLCSRCDGTGQRARLRRVFLPRRLMQLKARSVRIRLYRQTREAQERMARAETFEQDHAQTLRLLRENMRVIPIFERYLQEAYNDLMITDARITDINERYERRRQEIEARQTAQREADASTHLGMLEGERITLAGTIRHYFAFPGDTRVQLTLITDSGNWVFYAGRARNLQGLQSGQRIRFDVRVGHLRRRPYRRTDGSVMPEVQVVGTQVNRPSQVRRIDNGE